MDDRRINTDPTDDRLILLLLLLLLLHPSDRQHIDRQKFWVLPCLKVRTEQAGGWSFSAVKPVFSSELLLLVLILLILLLWHRIKGFKRPVAVNISSSPFRFLWRARWWMETVACNWTLHIIIFAGQVPHYYAQAQTMCEWVFVHFDDHLIIIWLVASCQTNEEIHRGMCSEIVSQRTLFRRHCSCVLVAVAVDDA